MCDGEMNNDQITMGLKVNKKKDNQKKYENSKVETCLKWKENRQSENNRKRNYEVIFKSIR